MIEEAGCSDLDGSDFSAVKLEGETGRDLLVIACYKIITLSVPCLNLQVEATEEAGTSYATLKSHSTAEAPFE